MLTPIELQGKVFKTGFGYDKKDVESFLKDVVENYESLYKENLELNDKINVLSEGVQYYKSMEKTLQKALVLAEKTAQDTENMAKQKAEAIITEAQKKAELIRKEAVANADKITTEALQDSKSLQLEARKNLDNLRLQITMLVQQFESYKIKYKQLLAAQTELLENESFSIDFSILKEQLADNNDNDTPHINDDATPSSDLVESVSNYEEKEQHHKYVIRDIAPEESKVYEAEEKTTMMQEHTGEETVSMESKEQDSHPVMDDDFLPTIDLSGILDEVKKDTNAAKKVENPQVDPQTAMANKPKADTPEEENVPLHNDQEESTETSDYDYDEQEELSEQDLLQQLFSVNPKKKAPKRTSSGKSNDFEFLDL